MRNIDAETLKQTSNERNKTNQKNRELEKSLGIALQAIKRLEARVQANEKGKAREEQRKPVLDEGKKVNFFPTMETTAVGSRRTRRGRISLYKRRRETLH